MGRPGQKSRIDQYTLHAWDTLHTWGSMALIAGVGAHLALHWSWLVCITGRMVRDLFKLLKPARRLETQCEVM